ncbi:MAG: nucleotidyl transferase AbiEii/AbiGii toxin family protein [Candidatus Aminicenantia bacterium]
MIDILEKELENFKSREEKFNHLRELLQILILKIIFDTGFFKNIVFTGGTALRILYDLRRFSEDLDFSLVNKKGYSLDKFSITLKTKLTQYNIEPEVKVKEKKVVQELSIKFKKILYDLGISHLSGQSLLIKIEIDTQPPRGGNIEISLVNKLFMFTITHFDLASLYATKLHACFFRRYTKGRDFYDLLWYLTKGIEPNYMLLNNTIKQTHKGESLRINRDNFYQFLLEKISRVDFAKIKRDVERFLVNKNEVRLLDKEKFIGLIKKKYKEGKESPFAVRQG